MAATAMMFLAALVGTDAPANVEVGWRPLPSGGMQYLIQIDPMTVEVLRTGQAIESYIPPHVKDVRGFQVGIGRGKLPRIDPPVVSPPVSGQKSAGVGHQPPTGEGGRPGLAGFAPGASLRPAKANPSESPAAAASESSKLPPWGAEKPRGSNKGANKETPPPQLPAELTGQLFPEKSMSKSAPGKASAATFEQWVGNKDLGEKATPRAQTSGGQTAPARPWTALTLALAGLFGSLGGNVYLGWLLVETRRRYRVALRRLKRAENEAWDAPPSEDAYHSGDPEQAGSDP